MANEMMLAGPRSPITSNEEVIKLLNAVQTGDYDERRNSLLCRAITTVERQVLQRRAAELTGHLAPGKYANVAESVSKMISGFGASSGTDEEAAETIGAQYATILKGMTLWAVERACYRFGAGEVEAAEVGAKRMDRNFAPTTAQLKMVATAIEKPYRAELARINRALLGTIVRQEPPPAERERMKGRFDILKSELGAKIAVTNLAEAEERKRKAIERNARAIEDEYRRAGVEPYVSKGVVISLSMMRSRGWTIEEVAGKRVLVAPAPRPPYEPRKGECS